MSTKGQVEESDPEESCDNAHVQVVSDNLPPELNLDQQAAARKFIRDRAELKSDFDIARTNLVQYVINTGIHRSFKQPLHRHPLAHL